LLNPILQQKPENEKRKIRKVFTSLSPERKRLQTGVLCGILGENFSDGEDIRADKKVIL
jgi:hypothetical protein